MFFIISIDSSCHTLFSIGIMASVLNCWDHHANSFVQKFLTTSSLMHSIISYLKSLFVSALIISKIVDSGLSRRAKKIILSTCSSFAFQLLQKNFLKMSMNHFASTCLDSLDFRSSGFMQNGNFSSVGSNIITSFLRSSGICMSASSKLSPCGSMSQTHLHCLISSIIRLIMNLDLPTQVLPIMYVCFSLSSSYIQTGTVIER